MFKAIDTSNEFVLTTRLDDGQLFIEMRHYDMEGLTFSCFELILNDAMLSDNILRVFDSVEELF